MYMHTVNRLTPRRSKERSHRHRGVAAHPHSNTASILRLICGGGKQGKVGGMCATWVRVSVTVLACTKEIGSVASNRIFF